MGQNQQSLSKVAKWILDKFIPKSSNWKIDVIDGFSGQDLKGVLDNAYTTDELAKKIFQDGILDKKHNSEGDAKQHIYNAISELKNASEQNNWGFYIRSVPRAIYKEQKVLDGLGLDRDFTKKRDYAEYRILISDVGLMLEVANLYNKEKAIDLITKQVRWVNKVGALDRSKSRSYGDTADNLLDAGRHYTNLLTNSNMFLPDKENSEKSEKGSEKNGENPEENKEENPKN